MVKEVEFSNYLELLNDGQPYSDGVGQEMFGGVLSNEAKTLTLTVGHAVPTPSEGVRKILLYFGNIDFDNRLTDYVKLGETEFDSDTVNRNNRTYEFDLSKVLIIPRKIYNARGTSEIIIELYTYEANINTDYGTKRLSVPYSIESDTAYEYDNSTDGVYKMYTIDYNLWDISVTYNKGDLIYFNDGVVKSLSDGNTGNNPGSTSEFWGTPTEEDILDFAHGATVNPPRASIITDTLISRHAKYKYILDTLTGTGFKSYDNKKNTKLAGMLQTLREKSLISLLENKPIDAAHDLQMLKLSYSKFTDTTEVRNYEVKYTI